MGWLRTLLLGDIGNRLDIGDNEDRIKHLRKAIKHHRQEKRGKDRSQDEAIVSLQAEVDDLKIALAAMGNLLVSKGLIQSAEWQHLLEAIDAESSS